MQLHAKAASAHPMVAVPDAVRKVLEETLKICSSKESEDENSGSEEISLAADSWKTSLSRHLAEDIVMGEPGYPPYRASIMDGYAIISDKKAAIASAEGWTHQVVDRVHAGDEKHPSVPGPINPSFLSPAYYITTGAVVPEGFDCVVPIENCIVSDPGDGPVRIRVDTGAAIQPGKWIRPIGCDIPPGSIVVSKGSVLDGVAIGLIKQAGIKSIRVKKKVVVGVLSTGNELANETPESNDKLGTEGCIPDVNRPILMSILDLFGHCKPIDLGICRDDSAENLSQIIRTGLEVCDVIITSGGVSMGETDIVEKVLVDKCGGTLHFGRMHMKPGKPTTFVTIPRVRGATALVFAMPGNPVSATVCTHLIVKPCIDLLYSGIPDEAKEISTSADKIGHVSVHPELAVALGEDLKLDFERPEYHRATVNFDPKSGQAIASSTGVQRSSRLMSLRDAQGLLMLPQATENQTVLKRGERVTMLLFRENALAKSVKVKHSIHLYNKPPQQSHQIAVIEIGPSGTETRLPEFCKVSKAALSGSNSGPAKILAKTTFEGTPEGLYKYASSFLSSSKNKNVDILIMCVSTHGPDAFQNYLKAFRSISEGISSEKGSKSAEALAMQVRQGASLTDPTAAIFAPFVGFSSRGSMIVLVSDRGLNSGLGNIRGLMKHALNLGQSKTHNQHHRHQITHQRVSDPRDK